MRNRVKMSTHTLNGLWMQVVLYGMVRGVQEDFSPEVLSATISSTLVPTLRT